MTEDVSEEIFNDLMKHTVERLQSTFEMVLGQHLNGRQTLEAQMRISFAMLGAAVAHVVYAGNLEEDEIDELCSMVLMESANAIDKGVKTGLEMRKVKEEA